MEYLFSRSNWTSLAVLTLGLGIFLAVWWQRSVVHDERKAQLWAKLPTVGIPSGGIFPWSRALLRSLTATQENVHFGYKKFSKKQKPFALPTIWTGDAVVVLPPSMLELLHKPDSEMRSFEAQVETLQLPYMISDRDVYTNVIHFDVVRKHMGEKDLQSLAAVTAEEIDVAFRECWGTAKEWTTLNAWGSCGRIVTRAATRTLLGLPLCRDVDFFEQSRLFSDSVVMGSAVINCFPLFMRGLVGPLVALRAKYYQARCLKTLVPYVEQRIRLWKSGKQEAVPNDFLQCMIPHCDKQGPQQMGPVRIATRILAANIMFAVGMAYVFSNCILETFQESSSKEEVLSGLEAECRHVYAKYDGLSSNVAVSHLHRVDSTIRESMRISDFNVAGLARDIVSDHLDLGKGMEIPRGVRIVFPTQPMHLDPSVYDDPMTFDAFRFSRKFEGMVRTTKQDSRRESLTDINPSFLAWGYGKHMCPGRWFAAQTMKQALAHIILNYEVEVVKKPEQRKALLSIMMPSTSAQIRIRRRI